MLAIYRIIDFIIIFNFLRHFLLQLSRSVAIFCHFIMFLANIYIYFDKNLYVILWLDPSQTYINWAIFPYLSSKPFTKEFLRENKRRTWNSNSFCYIISHPPMKRYSTSNINVITENSALLRVKQYGQSALKAYWAWQKDSRLEFPAPLQKL